jgi:hypothetical protein
VNGICVTDASHTSGGVIVSLVNVSCTNPPCWCGAGVEVEDGRLRCSRDKRHSPHKRRAKITYRGEHEVAYSCNECGCTIMLKPSVAAHVGHRPVCERCGRG